MWLQWLAEVIGLLSGRVRGGTLGRADMVVAELENVFPMFLGGHCANVNK